MTRNLNPFTERQIRLLEAIQKKLFEINDPEPEIITDESYEWQTEQTKQFGKIPKIKFYPNACLTKSEIIEKAKLIDESRRQKRITLREKILGKDTPKEKECCFNARLFESEWNNIMFKTKKAAFTVAIINQLFCSMDKTVSELIENLQRIILEEYAPRINNPKNAGNRETRRNEILSSKDYKAYDQVIEEIEETDK